MKTKLALEKAYNGIINVLIEKFGAVQDQIKLDEDTLLCVFPDDSRTIVRMNISDRYIDMFSPPIKVLSFLLSMDGRLIHMEEYEGATFIIERILSNLPDIIKNKIEDDYNAREIIGNFTQEENLV